MQGFRILTWYEKMSRTSRRLEFSKKKPAGGVQPARVGSSIGGMGVYGTLSETVTTRSRIPF
jgi:hypothetical protein